MANTLLRFTEITLQDDAGEPGVLDTAGEKISYTVTLTVEPGNDADTYALNVDFSDTLGVLEYVSGDDGDGKLEAGETWVYRGAYTLTQDDLDADTQISNVATASLSGPYDPLGPGAAPAVRDVVLPSASQSATSFLEIQPAIHIEKATNSHDADTPAEAVNIAAGGSVTWTYVVTNTGNSALSDVAVVDDNGTPDDASDDLVLGYADLVSGDLDGDARLDVGETWTFTASGQAQEDAYANIATVSGQAVNGATVEDDDPSHYFGVRSEIDIEKATNEVDADTADEAVNVAVGGAVTWTYVVTNTGNSDLTNVAVSDDRIASLVRDVSTDIGGDGVLSAGESWSYTATGAATEGLYANLGSVTATDVLGATVEDDDPSHYFGVRSEIVLVKEGAFDDGNGDGYAQVGETITYTYAVTTGTGNVALSNIVLTDDAGTPDDPSDDFAPTLVSGDASNPGVLDLGETWIFTHQVAITQAQIDVGGIVNIACVTGEDPVRGSVGDCDDADVPLTPPPAPPPPGNAGGNTPGFWKNHPAIYEAVTDFAPEDTNYVEVFGITEGRCYDKLQNHTLQQALSSKGGGLNALARHSAAAYANAESEITDYSYIGFEDELAQVIDTLLLIDLNDDGILDVDEVVNAVQDLCDQPSALSDNFSHFTKGDVEEVKDAFDFMNNVLPEIEKSDLLEHYNLA